VFRRGRLNGHIMRDYLFVLNDTSSGSGALLVDVVRVREDAYLHDLV
jgi:hypothetical protein